MKVISLLLFFIESLRALIITNMPDYFLGNPYIGLLGIVFAIIIAAFFFIREKRIKKNYRKLEQELDDRMKEIIHQEKKISKQKEKLQKQIELSEDQNQLIHKQAVELDKHRHLLEKKVELRTNELVTAKEKAVESDRLKTAFLENISHEIRTPMNAIMGFASLLGYPGITKEEESSYVTRINRNCKMLLHLIDGILDMSKLQAEQMILVKTSFSVNKLLREIHQELVAEHDELTSKDIVIDLSLPEENKDFILYSDAVRIQQVITNLLSNATKYTEKGSIRLGYYPLFDSDYDKEPSSLQFYVEDTGIGISHEKSEYIFEWFNKIEEDRSKLYRGAGLGLYLSKEIISLLGGRIWFNSKVDEGSCFNFTLPFLNTSEGTHSKIKEAGQIQKKEQSQDYDWRNKTILIVEDELNNIIYLSEILKKTGAVILTAQSGREAVNIAESKKTISIVLMDIMMPEMDGYEATRQIKKLRPQLPVIAQTAYTKSREKEKSLEAGCEGYISKPYDPPSLFKLIDNFL